MDPICFFFFLTYFALFLSLAANTYLATFINNYLPQTHVVLLYISNIIEMRPNTNRSAI